MTSVLYTKTLGAYLLHHCHYWLLELFSSLFNFKKFFLSIYSKPRSFVHSFYIFIRINIFFFNITKIEERGEVESMIFNWLKQDVINVFLYFSQ